MSGISSNTNPNNTPFQDPTLLSNPQQENVGTTGPGGTTGAPVLPLGADMITAFQGPSNQGMGRSSQNNKVSPDLDKSLSPPSTDVAPFTINESWVNMFASALNTPQTGSRNDTDDDSSFGFTAGGGDDTDASSSFSVMAAPGDLGSTNPATVLKALLSFTGQDKNGSIDPDVKKTLKGMADQIAMQNQNGTPPAELASGNSTTISNYLTSLIPDNTNPDTKTALSLSITAAGASIAAATYTSGMQSTDKDTVLSTLQSFTGVNQNPDLSDATKAALNDKLGELADKLVAQNKTGSPDPALTSYDPETVKAYLASLVDVSTLPKDAQVAFAAAIGDAANSISSINATSGTLPPKPTLISNITSTDQAVVLQTLKDALASKGMSKQEIAALGSKLDSLATNIATANAKPGGAGLDITDPEILKAILAAIATTNDSSMDIPIAKLAGAIAGQFNSYYTELAKSSDPSVVFDALRHLSNIDHNPNLTPQERQAGLDYLKLMASAIAFMSTVRAKISMLEAQLRKAENEGKLANIKDQTKAAHDAFKTGIEKIAKDLQKTLDALAMKALMAILGPIIMVIIAIIMAIITIFSFGTAAPVAAAIMVAVIVAMTVIAIADQATGMFEKAGEACSKDPAGQKAASFGFQAIIMAIMIAFSFGLMAFAVAAQSAVQGAVAAVREAIKEIIKELMKEGIAKKVAQFVVGELISLLMSSGLLTEGLTKMFKAMGMSDKDADMAAMIMSIVVMLVMMFAIAKMASSAVKSGVSTGAKMGKDAADKGVELALDTAKKVTFNAPKTAAEQADEVADAAKKAAADAAADAAKAASGAAKTGIESGKDIFESAIKNLTKKLASLAETMKMEPSTVLLLLQGVGMLAQVGQSINQAVYSFNQADLLNAQAKLTTANADSQALIELLKQLMPTIDFTQQDLDQDSKDFMTGYTNLMNLFANMVSSASAIVTTTSQTS